MSCGWPSCFANAPTAVGVQEVLTVEQVFDIDLHLHLLAQREEHGRIDTGVARQHDVGEGCCRCHDLLTRREHLCLVDHTKVGAPRRCEVIAISQREGVLGHLANRGSGANGGRGVGLELGIGVRVAAWGVDWHHTVPHPQQPRMHA